MTQVQISTCCHTKVSGCSKVQSCFAKGGFVKKSLCFTTAFVVLLTAACNCVLAGDSISWSLGGATVSMTGQGIPTVTFADGTAWPGGDLPAFQLELTDGTVLLPAKVECQEENQLVVTYSDGSIAEYKVTLGDSFLLFHLQKLESQQDISKAVVLQIPVPAEAEYAPLINTIETDEKIVSVMPATVNVHVRGRTTGGTPEFPVLALDTVARHGLAPATAALVISTTSDWERVVPLMEEAAGLPSPKLGGVWNKISPEIRQSYFFLTYFKESQFDDALALAERGGFKMILLLCTWAKSHGHYEVNTEYYPDGVASLKRVMNKFRDHGIKSGLHFLGASIDVNDSWLTPVPDKRLVKGAQIPLAQEITVDADFIPTATAPTGFPTEETNPYMDAGRTLWIDDELILYESVSLEEPYGFSGCRRGQYGTAASPHTAQTPIDHLVRAYGYFMHDLNSSLSGEVADALARTANEVDAQMIYFDGSELLQRPEDADDWWYYSALLQKTFADRITNKDILYQGSSTTPWAWHLMARNASADGHDDLRAYLEERSGSFDYFKLNHLPLDIGWYYAYDKRATPDMYEYILNKTIAYDSSMSLQMSVDAAHAHPFTGEILDMIKQYDELRVSGVVSQEMRDRMRIDPVLFHKKTEEERNALLDYRRDFHLTEKAGQRGFQRIIYDLWQDVPASNTNEFAFELVVKTPNTAIGFDVQVNGDYEAGQGPALTRPSLEVEGNLLESEAILSSGQYAFYRPGEPLAQFGLPLTGGSYSNVVGNVTVLPEGTYTVTLRAAEPWSSSLRVRTVQYTEEFYPIP
ncbi:MAG: hypothetical protein Q4G68_00070 [Planctomycetia bacterium]|nr:hypothetical protein [Planctomycetia bacterium]